MTYIIYVIYFINIISCVLCAYIYIYIWIYKWSSVIHDTQSAQISQMQDEHNIYVIMKTICPPSYPHNGYVATYALGHIMYGCKWCTWWCTWCTAHGDNWEGTLFSWLHIYMNMYIYSYMYEYIYIYMNIYEYIWIYGYIWIYILYA